MWVIRRLAIGFCLVRRNRQSNLHIRRCELGRVQICSVLLPKRQASKLDVGKSLQYVACAGDCRHVLEAHRFPIDPEHPLSTNPCRQALQLRRVMELPCGVVLKRGVFLQVWRQVPFIQRGEAFAASMLNQSKPGVKLTSVPLLAKFRVLVRAMLAHRLINLKF